MTRKPTYEELEQKIKEAEKKALREKQIVEASAQKNIALNSFMNNISDMAWVKDSDSRFIAVNKAFCEAVGMEAESLINHTCEVCFTKEEAEKFREDELQVMEDKKQRIIEEKIIDSEKNEVWLETIKSPTLDESGKVMGTVGIARDISKRKQTEVELAYKTALLEAQSQTSIDGILVIDSEGKVVMSNERMREMWNIPQEIWKSGDDEILLQHAITLLKYPDEFLEKVRYLYTHKNEKSRNEIALKDGRYFDRYSSPLIDSTNKYHGRIWFFRDITKRKKAELALEKLNLELEERVEQRTAEISKAYALLKQKMDELKQTEEELNESEEKYKELFERSLDCIYIHDFAGNFIDANQTALDLFGYTKNEVTSLNFTSILSEDELLKAFNTARDIIEKGVQNSLIEYKVKKKNGDYFYIESTGSLIYKDGKPHAIMGSARDITARIRAEEALRTSEERYQLATKGGNVGVWDWNLTTDKMFTSPNLKLMLGYEDEKISGHIEDWGKHVYAEDVEVVMKEANACIEGKKKDYHVEHRMVHKDGSIRWFLASGKVERDDNGQAVRFVGTVTDITNIKQLEEQLQQSQKMEALGTLAGGIAHEFNNILGIILGNTELAIDDVPEWNPAANCLKKILSASFRAKDVVHKILGFAHKTPAAKKPIKISLIVKECMKLLRAMIPATIDIQQNILCESEVILSDPTEINQVLVNLCTNAMHAMSDMSGVLKVALEAINLDYHSVARYKDLKPGNFAKLTVKDTGEGISPNIINRIFDPYFTTKEVDQGLGMGLAVVYGIVKKNDGAIHVESKVGKGTTVEILFPLIEEQTEPEVTEFETLPKGSERILFVDDEEPLVEMFKKVLERFGYDVVGQTDSLEALKVFESEPDRFDLVITDMAMLPMPGDKLAQELIRIRPKIPIILCTGHSSLIDEEKAKQLGIAAYLMKPIAMMEMAKTIRKVLDETKNG